MKTIGLEVIAMAKAPEEEPEATPQTVEPEEPTPPAEVFVIHVAPSPRLDPSTDLDKVEIVMGNELEAFAGQKPFLVDR